jgi:hypothetical protein
MRNILILCFSLVLGACGTMQVSPKDVASKAAPIFGAEFTLLYVPSKGAIADATFIKLSKSSPSAMSHKLASEISLAETEPVYISVGGPNSSKSAAVIEGALIINGGKQLPHLKLVFVGAESDSEKIKQAVQEIEGEYHFAQSSM